MMQSGKLNILLTLGMALLILPSCKKEPPLAEVGQTEVEIVFINPKANQTFLCSSQVSLEARIDANAMMSGYRITISNAETGDVIDTLDDMYEQTQFIVHHHWYPDVSQSTTVQIKLEALEQNLHILGADSITIVCSP